MKHSPIGIKDIAKHAGVSTGPVDKVLNNRGGVSKATRDRIMQAIAELGYEPNILASRLKSAKQFRIAVLVPQATDEIQYWQEHIKGINVASTELRPFGFTIDTYLFHQNNESSFSKQAQEVLNEPYDGVFMVPVFDKLSTQFVQNLSDRKTAVIFFDTQLPELPNIPFIGQHSLDSGFLAGELMDKCLTKDDEILIVSLTQRDDNHMHFTSREQGFRTFYKGKSTNIIKFQNSDLDRSTIDVQLAEVFEKNKKIKGIFVTNGIDEVAPLIANKELYTLIGYDLTERNIAFLKNEKIDFLISQRPHMQAYSGLRLFYDLLILKKDIKKRNYLPIEIIMKSNLIYQSDLFGV